MKQQSGRAALPIILAGILVLFTAANSLAQLNLLAGPSALDFVAPSQATQPDRQTVFVASSGVSLPYKAKIGYTSAAVDWLSLEGSSGLTPATLTVIANAANLPDGVYFGYLEITTDVTPSTILNVTLRVGGAVATGRVDKSARTSFVSPAGIFAGLPETLTFHAQTGHGGPRSQAFFLRGSHSQFTATSSEPWVSLAANGTSNPGQLVTGTSGSYLQVSVDSTGLSAGKHSASILIDSPGTAGRVLPVTLTVSDQPALVAEPSTLSFQLHNGDPVPSPRIITIQSTGENLNYTASSTTGSWLAIGPQTGSTSGTNTLSITVNPADLPAENQTGYITVVAPGVAEPLTIPVSANVTAAATGLTVDKTSITLQGPLGTPVQMQTLNLTSSTGAQSFSVKVVGSNEPSCGISGLQCWLSVTPATGTTPATLTVKGDPSLLRATGTYTGMLDITNSSGSEEVFVSVTFIVGGGGAGITPSPSSLAFTQTVGGAAPAAQTVQLTGTSGTGFTASSNATWLTVTPASGTIPATLTLTANGSTLAAGTYQASVSVTGSATPISVTLAVTSSGITAAPSSLSFTQTVGGAAPATQTVQLSGSSGTSFTASSNATWLTVTPSSGTVPATLTLTANGSTLPAGTYQASVTISGGASPVSVTLTVTSTAGITANPSSITFTQTLGGTAPPTQTVQLSAATATSFTAASTATWLTVTPASGTTPANLTLAVNASGLNAGTYLGYITVTSGGTLVSISVTLTVTTGSTITATPTSLTFSQIFGTGSPPTQTVQLSSTTATAFTASSNASWLTVSPTSGTTPAALTVSAGASGLAVGPYQGVITITSGTSSTSVSVTLNISAPGTSSITATPPAVVFSQTFGQAAFSLQNIQLTAPGSTSFTATSDSTWLLVSPSSGSTPATLTLTGMPGMAVGTYQGNINVAGGVTPLSIPVTLIVSLASNAIAATPTQVSFSQIQGASTPPAQSVQLASPSPTAFTVTAPTSTWLTVTPTTGTTPASLTFNVNTTGLSIGAYQDSITVNGGVSPIVIPVTLTISADVLTPTPASLSFTQTVGAAAANPQTVQLTSGAPRFFTASTTSSWITVTPASGTTPASLTITANGDGMAVGSYQGTVTVNGAGPALSIPVTLTVAAATGAVFTPASLAFTFTPGGQPPASQTVAVTSPGSPFSFNVTAQAANLGNWLSVTPTSGTTPSNLTVAIATAGLAAGKYTGIITVTPTDTSLPAQTLPVTLSVSGGTTSTIFVRSVLNGASFLPGPVAAGEIVTVTGLGLGPATGAGPHVLPSGAIDTLLAGTRVLFDGIPSPLLYVRADQINAIVPYNVYGRTATNLQVEVAGVLSDVIGLRVENTAPAVFTSDGSGRGTGAIVNQDGTINGPSFPAPAGSIVAIYGTGEGQTIPAGQDGRIIATDLRSPIAPVAVRIGGVPVQVRYAGSAPGQVSGLFQINVLLPATLAAGAQLPVEVQIGNIVSQAGVTMAVK